MQSLSHISVGIAIQALSQMSSFTIMFLKYDLSHQSPWLLLKEALTTSLCVEYCYVLLPWPWQMQSCQMACSYRPSPYPCCCLVAAFLLLPHITGQPWMDLHQQGSYQLVCTWPPPVGFLSTFVLSRAASHLLQEIPVGIKLLDFFVPSLRPFSGMMNTENADMLLAC